MEVGYKTHQDKFYQAIQKYGWDNFEHIILYSNLTQDEAEQKEQELIKYYDSIKNGYNVELGGRIHKHSQETKNKITEANRNRIITPQMRKNFSKGQLGNNNRGKAVECIETGEIYPSAEAAARVLNISGGTAIRRCCKNDPRCKTVKGYHWKYAE